MNSELDRFSQTVKRLCIKLHPHKLSQGESAARLGVSREHLNLVLNGRRQSRRLLRRYQELTSL